MSQRNAMLLTLSVGSAFLSRLLSNVFLRPEFVGWFNHSPYYWVQTKALLQDGALAYEDMPLLFALYAGIAQILGAFGISIEDAVILASRLSMAITPALLPVVFYFFAKQASDGNRLSTSIWCLIFASGFLPLTYAHMPEILQKNMLGMLLLACALLVVLRWQEHRQATLIVMLVAIMIIILLTHLGTALAALLLVGAVLLETVFGGLSRQTTIRFLSFGLLAAVAFVIGIYYLYPSALDRVQEIVAAFTPDSALQAAGIVALLATWAALSYIAWRWLAKQTAEWRTSVAALARISVMWALLLVLPLWPGEIGMRLTLFLPLALIALLILLLSQRSDQRLITFVSVGVAAVFCVVSAGEAVSQFLTYPDKELIAAELSAVKQEYELQHDDLVITPYGVGPTANWFLGTKAALLTAVNRNVFDTYARVFVMNTLERPAPKLEQGACKTVQTANDRYWTTRHDIPLEHEQQADTAFVHLAFYELKSLPGNWVFDDAGVWLGWGNCDGI